MIEIRPLSPKYFQDIIKFTDKEIGLNYFDESSLWELYNQSQTHFGSTSFVAYDEEKIVAIRLTRMHGCGWINTKKTNKEKWNANSDKVAYFQSLFVDPAYQNHGLGSQLSLKSIEVLKLAGAEAIVSHSHVESPNNSSFKYLSKLGFKEVKFFKHYWKHIDYFCSACHKNPCECSAIEMILYL